MDRDVLINIVQQKLGIGLKEERQPACFLQLNLIAFRMNRRIGFLILFAAFLAQAAFAQVADLKFEQITSQDGLPQNTIHGIAKDKYGFMWFGTWGGLCRYDGYSFKIYRNDPQDSRSINNNRIHNIIKDADQNIWVLTFLENELCRYNYEKDDFERTPAAQVPPALLQQLSREKHLQESSYTHGPFKWRIDVAPNALVRHNLNTGEQTTYDYNPANPWSLNDAYVTDIYKDNQAIFWVGTFSSGLNKANLNAKPFAYYYHDRFNPYSIIDNKVTAIAEDKAGNLWIGTRDKGITVIGENGYRHYSSNSGKNTLYSNQIRRIFCDSRGFVWIGSKMGLDRYDPATATFHHFADENLLNTAVFGITEDSAQHVWIASWSGITKYNPATDELVHFSPDKLLKNGHARVILHDRKGQIWVGTEGGGVSVLQVAPSQNALTPVKHILLDATHTNTISDNRINTLHEDKEGFIWIGSGKGLVRYNPSADTFRHFPAQSILAETAIAAILEDEQGHLWISHKKGITQLHKKTFAIRNFTLEDGLQSNEFADGAALNSRFQHKFFLGGSNGFNAFNPAAILPDSTIPNTVLTNLQILNQTVRINQEINGRVVLTKPLYLTDAIELTYNDKSVAIEFAGLHYANPKGNKYAYKLEGFDKDWVYTDAGRRIATYSNLAPGDYTFQVISSNSDGIWNKEPAVLKLVVRPPFWASTWAYLVYAALLLALLYLYHRYSLRYSRLKAKLSYELLLNEKEKELHQNKLQFFTNISHEIKTPLSLILAPVEKLLHLFSNNQVVVSELKTMKANGDRLSKLINQLLDFRRLETGHLALQLQQNNLVALLQKTLRSFEPLAEAKNIQLTFTSAVDACYFRYDEDKLEKVMANLLSNALKFTPPQGWVRVTFQLQDAAAGKTGVIAVTNTGKTIPASEYENIFKPFQQVSGNKEEGTGLGLAYSKGLLELHGGTIEVKSTPATGSVGETTFTIVLPVPDHKGVAQEEAATGHSEREAAQAITHLPALVEQEAGKPEEEQVLLNGKVPLVLLVEDNANLRNYLCDYFRNQYQVLEASNGLDGFQLASQAQPDLIISDVEMPGMDGFELCSKVKTEPKTAHIPVILLTARTPVEDEIAGIETGADDYITKPFNLALLTARVKHLLISRNQLKAKYRTEIALEPTEDVPLSADEQLLQDLLHYVEARLADANLNVDDICTALGVSRTQLYRKVKALTGLGVAEIIKEIRLKRAKQLLKEQRFNINEIAYLTGFSEPDYFRKCFKAEFGLTASEYARQLQEQ
ncbi:hybrid sensor histidine kinase/response regulator transcription factor [Botryobacter ruber]|uniref:hybrid sensor histidine kinase/response regulator transcription factor n=1 Tax=Botryobacter ruber TaxID=2171629 RepID=UPI000F65426F|nr:hybrid sensor histidine kinase/response regulator transcription factor [Botryobacter ruber]